jgi:hypothetical protein
MKPYGVSMRLSSEVQQMHKVMERFVVIENIKHYRRLLEITGDENERAVIAELLADEIHKYKDTDDPPEED